MTEQIAREEGRRLFGLNPEGYDDARPDYPEWIFEGLRDHGSLAPGAATLEIGPGTGRATRRLLDHGAGPLTLVEPDVRFREMLEAVVATASAPCELIFESFEDARLPSARFQLVVAATAFHWLSPVLGLEKIRSVLAPGGAAALFWNVLTVLGEPDAFHDATQALLAPLSESPSGAPDRVPFALDRSARENDARSAGFERVDYFESTWTVALNTERVGKLYESFSHIQRLAPDARAKVLTQLMEVAEREFAGRVERNVTSCLYLLR